MYGIIFKWYRQRLKLYGHVKRRDEGHVLRRMLDAPIKYQERDGEEGIQPGGKTGAKRYGKCVVKEEDVLDRTKWNNDIHNHSVDPR